MPRPCAICNNIDAVSRANAAPRTATVAILSGIPRGFRRTPKHKPSWEFSAPKHTSRAAKYQSTTIPLSSIQNIHLGPNGSGWPPRYISEGVTHRAEFGEHNGSS